ncbi:MAG: AraC family transcriptional regulator, partial [Flavobacteriales bacterium]|nr:AraC family transcriptional regulator [Flavobacteriales bacterium]
MYFDFNEKSSILLFFMLHGVVFGLLLLLKGLQNQDKASLWLSAFTFLSSLYIAPFVFGYAGWYTASGYREALFYIPFQQLFLLPPVLYFYCKTLLDRSFVFSKKDYLHFLPATLYLLYSALVFVTDTVILNDIYFYRDGRDKDFSLWYQIVGFFMLLIYLLKSLQTYNRYKKITYDTLSFADAFLFTWAKRFLVAFLLLLSIRLLFFIINPEWGEFGKKFWYYCSFSVLFYYVSI